MAKNKLSRDADREEARRLRRAGLSIGEISKRVKASKGSVSPWVKDIKLTPKQKRKLKENQVSIGTRIDNELIKTIRELRRFGASYTEISTMLKISDQTAANYSSDIKIKSGIYITNNSEKFIKERVYFQKEGRVKAREKDLLHLKCCMLYWAEGAKTSTSASLCNSDTEIIKIFIKFLRTYFPKYNNKIVLILAYYLNNGISENEIKKYWLSITNLTEDNFRKHQVNIIPKSSKSKRKGKLPYGVATVKLSKVDVFSHIIGAINEYIELENGNHISSKEEEKWGIICKQKEELKKIVDNYNNSKKK